MQTNHTVRVCVDCVHCVHRQFYFYRCASGRITISCNLIGFGCGRNFWILSANLAWVDLLQDLRLVFLWKEKN